MKKTGYGKKQADRNKLGEGSYGFVLDSSVIQKTSNPEALKYSFSYGNNYYITSLIELDIFTKTKDHPLCVNLNKFEIKPNIEAAVTSLTDKKLEPIVYHMEKGSCDLQNYYRSLFKSIPDGKTFDLMKLYKRIFVDILLSVEYLHSLNIIHRDIKTNNFIVFLDKNGEYINSKITDYSLGYHVCVNGDHNLNYNVVTANYRAPEIFLKKNYTKRSDVWSLACVMYEIFTHKYPFNYADVTMKEALVIKNIVQTFDFSNIDIDSYNRIYGDNYSSDSADSTGTRTDYKKKFLSLIHQNEHAHQKDKDLFIDLLLQMFQINSSERYTVSEALNHKYFDECRDYIKSIRTRGNVSRSGIHCRYLNPKSIIINNIGLGKYLSVFKAIVDSKITYSLPWFRYRVLIHSWYMFMRYIKIKNGYTDYDPVILIKTIIYMFVLMFDGLYKFDVFNNSFRLLKNDLLDPRKSDFETFKVICSDLIKIFNGNLFCFTIFESSTYIIKDRSFKAIMYKLLDDNTFNEELDYDVFLTECET